MRIYLAGGMTVINVKDRESYAINCLLGTVYSRIIFWI